MLAEMLQHELASLGLQVEIVGNGEEAIERIRTNPPDLLLLDLLMPKKTGYEVLQYIREQGITLPVVVLSNLSDMKEQQKCIDSGAKDFLIKSQLDPDQLWGKVEKYLL